MCHALNSTGWVVKNGVLQFLWMNQIALPNVLQLLSCKCQLNGFYVPLGDVRASQKMGCYVRRDACGSIGCQCQNENRERRCPGRCFACSDADQDKVKAKLLTPVMMTMQIDSYTVAGDGVPD